MAIQSRPCKKGEKNRILEIKIVLLQGTFKLNKRVIGKKHMARNIE
jgi:hypothetical protein